MSTTLPARPADPSKISFARDCFVDGEETVSYLVSRSALYSGPARFSDRAAADAFAKMTGRDVQTQRSRKQVRVRWA